MANGLCADENKLRTFDADWDRGQVVYRKNSTERPVCILTRSRTTDLLEVEKDPLAMAVLEQELKGVKLQEKLTEINDPPRLALFRTRGRRYVKDIRGLAVLGWNARGVLARQRPRVLEELAQ